MNQKAKTQTHMKVQRKQNDSEGIHIHSDYTSVKRKAKSKAKAKAKVYKKDGTLVVPQQLNRDAATILMGVLYAARVARPDLLRATQALASYLHTWTDECNDGLFRLMCYVWFTLHHRQICWIGDDINDIGIGVSADANFAGCPRTLRSTSGAHVAMEGYNTFFSIAGSSNRQTRTCNCTAEAELVAADNACTRYMCPMLDICDLFLPQNYPARFWEDNTACMQIITSGRNKQLRSLSRCHGLSIRSLHEKLGNVETNVGAHIRYQRSEWMAADIYTKAFAEKAKWLAAVENIGVMPPKLFKKAITRRKERFAIIAKEETSLAANLRPGKAKRITQEKQKGLEACKGTMVWDRHLYETPAISKAEMEDIDIYADMCMEADPKKEQDGWTGLPCAALTSNTSKPTDSKLRNTYQKTW